MSLSFFTIDDFYADPDSIRDYALNARYNDIGVDIGINVFSGNWPGRTSIDVYRATDIDGKISKILGLPIRQVGNSGKFRYAIEGDTAKYPLHIDGMTDDVYAGVLYLNRTLDPVPGTIFYSFKGSGTPDIVDTSNLDSWDVDLISYIRYNRLIVYPANRFHGPGPSFGTSVKDSRLVQLFLWQVIK
jgi:hypothetical protein